MEAWQRLRSSEESAEVAGLRARSTELLDLVASAARTRPGAVHRLHGLPALVLQLRRIAPAATRSCWVMQPQYAFDPEEPGITLARAARLRGVETRLLTRPATVQTHPLLSSIYPSTLLGPVFLRALIIDGRQVIVGGPDDATGQRTSWYTNVPGIVHAVVELWEATVPLCEPILAPGTEPPLNERQVEVARLLCLGEEDPAIAERLKLSTTRVESDVQTILEQLTAGNRTEAVLNICGRGVNGGRRGAYA
ncbi:MAG: LuxR C-terminal-related transcriptional regulator [Marmoricola sp.]